MSVRVRLTRVGNKKNPIWRVVVADQRAPRDGRSIETLGHYNPQTQPSTVVIDRERMDYWLERGAQPTGTVKKLLRAPNTEIAVATPVAPPAPVEEATTAAAEEQADAPADVAAATEPEVAAAESETPAPEATTAAEPASEPDPEAPAEDAPAEPETGSEPDPEAPSTESA